MAKGILTISEVEQEVAYHSGYVLTGMNFTKKEDGWLLIVKVASKKEGHLVTFIHSHSPETCLELLTAALLTTSFTLKWRKDVYKKG